MAADSVLKQAALPELLMKQSFSCFMLHIRRRKHWRNSAPGCLTAVAHLWALRSKDTALSTACLSAWPASLGGLAGCCEDRDRGCAGAMRMFEGMSTYAAPGRPDRAACREVSIQPADQQPAGLHRSCLNCTRSPQGSRCNFTTPTTDHSPSTHTLPKETRIIIESGREHWVP